MEIRIFQELKLALQEGAHKKGHPFRFFSLGTVSKENNPCLRTVVLRNVAEDLTITVYTDSRSEKVKQIAKNANVCLLFYDAEKQIQLRIDGVVSINNLPDSLEKIWANMHPNAKKEYITELAPGTQLEDTDELTYLTDKNYFCQVDIKPYQIEYLKLQSPQHLRVRFAKVNEIWESEFLVP